MANESPSAQEWKELYDAALAFKAIECWNYMYDSDVFGVRNPESGEIGYCCVMGRLGQHFALGVYLGYEGLQGHLKIQSGEVTGEDALFTQKCLMVSFEDRRYLAKEDHQIIKTLGLKFRGPNSWPVFRDMQPGYFPWFLTSERARFLTLALNQTLEVAQRFRDNPAMLLSGSGKHYLVRVPAKTDSSLQWTDEWLEPSPPTAKEGLRVAMDEARLERISKKLAKGQIVLEIGSFYTPRAVREGDERPYYPFLTFYVDHKSGLILGMSMGNPLEYQSGFVGSFFDVLERIRSLPMEILVEQEEAFSLLQPIAFRLGVRVIRVKELPELSLARKELMRFSGR